MSIACPPTETHKYLSRPPLNLYSPPATTPWTRYLSLKGTSSLAPTLLSFEDSGEIVRENWKTIGFGLGAEWLDKVVISGLHSAWSKVHLLLFLHWGRQWDWSFILAPFAVELKLKRVEWIYLMISSSAIWWRAVRYMETCTWPHIYLYAASQDID